MRRPEPGASAGDGGGAANVGQPGDVDPRSVVQGRPAAVSIRPMKQSDLTAVMTIEKAAFASPWTLATFASLLRRENTALWVAEVAGGGASAAGAKREAGAAGAAREAGAAGAAGAAGEIVAYAAVWMVADQAELGDIAVADGWRRRGIGTRLLETVLEAMSRAGIRDLFLEVRVSNESAQRLYARHGFEEVGRRPGYYTRPKEDALVLRRRVGPGQ